MSYPLTGSTVQIKSYKHNGKLHRIWRENFILKASDKEIIGANDRVRVIESDGDIWRTREPAVFYFHASFWFNVIGMIKEEGLHYYCNLSSPFYFEDQTIKYIDYDLDVRVYPDRTCHLLDEDEFTSHKKQMEYPEEIINTLYDHLEQLYDWIRQQKGPFAPDFIDHWYERYLTYM